MPFGALYAQVLDKCAETQGLGDGATHSADALAWQRVASRHPAGPEPRGCFPLGHLLLQMLRLLPAAVCAVRGAGTPPGPSAWASGTGRAAAEESLSHPAGGPHAKRRLLGPALGGFAATFRGLFSSSSQEVRLPGPALASCILFFFHEPSLHPIPNASGTLRAQV